MVVEKVVDRAEAKSMAKCESRDGRLQWSNQAEHIIRQELNGDARASCTEKVSAFVECSKSNGLMVVFKCRQANRDMNACLAKYTNEDAFAAYKALRTTEIIEIPK